MSAEITNNALLEIFSRALSPITTALETVRTRRAPTLWHDGIAEQKNFKVETHKAAAVWEYENPLKSTINIRSIGIIFDDKPTATWQPLVEIYVDDGRVFYSKGNAFQNADVEFELDRPLPRDRSVKVFIWNASTDVTNKTATFNVRAGEA